MLCQPSGGAGDPCGLDGLAGSAEEEEEKVEVRRQAPHVTLLATVYWQA